MAVSMGFYFCLNRTGIQAEQVDLIAKHQSLISPGFHQNSFLLPGET